MSLTINYKNGEFTCTFTPEGDSAITINGAHALTANLENVGDQEEWDHEDTAVDEDTTSSGQEDHQAGAEEYPNQVEVDDSPALVSHMTEDRNNGRAGLAYGYPALSENFLRETPLGSSSR